MNQFNHENIQPVINNLIAACAKKVFPSEGQPSQDVVANFRKSVEESLILLKEEYPNDTFLRDHYITVNADVTPEGLIDISVNVQHFSPVKPENINTRFAEKVASEWADDHPLLVDEGYVLTHRMTEVGEMQFVLEHVAAEVDPGEPANDTAQ